MKKSFLILLVVFAMLMSGCTRTIVTTEPSSETENNASEMEAESEKEEEGESSASKEETTSPVQLKEENLLPGMSAKEKKEVNIFLSNFSEARYDPSWGYYSYDEGLIAFAFTHASINSPSKVLYDGDYMGISASDADAILKRFFGKTVPHKTPNNSKEWQYRNNKFLMVAASGESYGDFSIATKMRLRDDGNYEVEFNVYTDPEICGGDVITDKTVYSLSDSEAAAQYDLTGRGVAVLKSKTYNGSSTYEIVSYQVENY